MKRLILLLVLYPISVFAENLFYEGEYIVEPNKNNAKYELITNITLAKKKKIKKITNSDYNYCEILIKSGKVKSCIPNYVIKIDKILSTPNDKYLSEQWGLGTIGAFNAWINGTGNSDIVVAIVDSGINYNHPDLAQNIWINPKEIPDNNIDDDNNGYVDDIYGISTLTNSEPFDDNGHGSHVAGIIGAVGNNGVGIAGVNWNVKILSCKFINSSGNGSLYNAMRCMDYILNLKKRGTNIVAINNSWGATPSFQAYSSVFENIIQKLNSAGILFVASSGNEANNNDIIPQYPSGYDVENIISVGAIDQNNKLANFSNFGKNSVDIVSPGVLIYSTYNNNSYRYMSGTSMSAPFVTGAIALYASKNPNKNHLLIKDRILNLAVTEPNLNNLVNANRVLNISKIFDEIVTVDKIVLTGTKKNKIKTGKKLKTEIFGLGNGNIIFNLFLNNKKCKENVFVKLQDGFYSKQFKLPKKFTNYKNIKIVSENIVSNQLKLIDYKKPTTKNLDRICSILSKKF